MYCYLQKEISKRTLKKKTFLLLASCQPLTKKAGAGSESGFIRDPQMWSKKNKDNNLFSPVKYVPPYFPRQFFFPTIEL
jgi:hypothetical protein